MPELAHAFETSGPANDLSPIDSIPASGVRDRIPPSIGADLARAIEDIAPENYTNYKTKPLGRGREHLVFEFENPKHRDIVYKINFQQTRPILETWLTHPDTAPDSGPVRERALEAMRREIGIKAEELEELRTYFGSGAVPATKSIIRNVPVSREIIKQLLDHEIPEDVDLPKTLPAWVTIQRRLELDPRKTASLEAGVPESPGHSEGQPVEYAKRAYAAGHALLIGAAKEESDHEATLDTIGAFYPKFRDLIIRVDNDDNLKTTLQHITKRMMDYMQSNPVLDFTGSKNMFLVKQEKGWDLKLVDPAIDDACRMYLLRDVATKLQNGSSLTEIERAGALVVLNALRAINGLAIIAGIPERLEAPEGVADIDPLTWKHELEKVYYPAA